MFCLFQTCRTRRRTREAEAHWQSHEPNDLFALRLEYEASNGRLHADPRHNGNISAVSWRNASDGVVRGYSYAGACPDRSGGDAISRLREAHYAAHSPGSTKWDAEVDRYDVPMISYDQNEERAELERVMGRHPSPSTAGDPVRAALA